MKVSNLLNSNNSSYEANIIISEFSKPIFLNKFFINKDFLLKNSETVIFNKDKWFHRVEKFCLDKYEEHNYYPIILMMNNLGSRFAFHPRNISTPYIIAPKKTAIITVMNL